MTSGSATTRTVGWSALALILSLLIPPGLMGGACADDAAANAYVVRCRACHGTDAAALAASSLRRHGDRIVTKKSATDLAAFLTQHGTANATERAEIEALLVQALAAK